MNKLDLDYQNLLKDILENGTKKETRNGGTISVFGRQIRHKMSDGFPVLTTKKMAWKTMVTELLWFLRGDTNIKFLVDNNCHIWDGDCFANYKRKINLQNNWEVTLRTMDVDTIGQQELLSQEEFINRIKTDDEFAKKWGDLGPIYGKQWRSWTKFEEYDDAFEVDILEENEDSVSFSMGTSGMVYEIDQIQNLINDLKTNPDSRRLMVNAWNVAELDQMVLPPCHYGFQVYTRELSEDERYDLCALKKSKLTAISEEDYIEYNIPTRAISLMWNQRSVDTFLGLPFNIASYGLLLLMIADEVNMVPDELIGNLGDTHLYLNHIEQAKEQIGRELSLEERRKMVTQEMFNQIYNGGGPETLSHSEIDQWGVPRTESREPYPLPTVYVRDGIFCSSVNDVILENYQSHPAIKASLSN